MNSMIISLYNRYLFDTINIASCQQNIHQCEIQMKRYRIAREFIHVFPTKARRFMLVDCNHYTYEYLWCYLHPPCSLMLGEFESEFCVVES